jgi:hypothetical protein
VESRPQPGGARVVALLMVLVATVSGASGVRRDLCEGLAPRAAGSPPGDRPEVLLDVLATATATAGTLAIIVVEGGPGDELFVAYRLAYEAYPRLRSMDTLSPEAAASALREWGQAGGSDALLVFGPAVPLPPDVVVIAQPAPDAMLLARR